MQFLIDIHKIKHYTMLNDIKSAKKQVKSLVSVSSLFDEKETYYWNKFQGAVMCEIGNYKKALVFFKVCLDSIMYINPSKIEIADLNYALGVTSSSLRKTSDAISYIKGALSFYQQVYSDIRCAQCHIVLGLSYRRSNHFNKALYHYQQSIDLARKLPSKNLIALSYLNMAHLFSVKGDIENCIRYYTLSLDNFTCNSDRALCLLGLTKEYFNIENYDLACECLTKGISLVDNPNKTSISTIYNEFLVYETLLNKDYERMEKIIKERLMPLLNQKNDYTKIMHYSNILSRYFAKKRCINKL